MKQLISRWYANWNEGLFQYLIKRYQIDLDEKFEKCSKGTKKKIEFIFSLSHNPILLVLDEPSAGVDMISRRKMKEDLIQFMENGERSVIIATHAIDEINQLCDEIMVMESGCISHKYNKDELYEQWARMYVSKVTSQIKNHPNVIFAGANQIVTNDRKTVEKLLAEEQVAIHHTSHLEIEEILEYLIDKEGANAF